MVSIKALDTLTPADLWREVPLEEDFRGQAWERCCRSSSGGGGGSELRRG